MFELEAGVAVSVTATQSGATAVRSVVADAVAACALRPVGELLQRPLVAVGIAEVDEPPPRLLGDDTHVVKGPRSIAVRGAFCHHRHRD
jgi:hypothetical protein